MVEKADAQMTFRVYFNRRSEFPWSVDTGPGTLEFTTKAIQLVDAHGHAIFDASAGDNKSTPTAWLEIRNATSSELYDQSATIFIFGKQKS